MMRLRRTLHRTYMLCDGDFFAEPTFEDQCLSLHP